jgi:hypothetical protein
MYSAKFTALFCGIVAAAAIAIGIAVQLSGSTTPDPLPLSFTLGASAITALVAGIVIAVTVRGGLLLAGCRQLAVRFVLIIAVVNVTILGILGTWPVKTYAVVLDMPSGQSGPPVVPVTFWFFIVVALVVPVLVAYIVGRLARGRVDAA